MIVFLGMKTTAILFLLVLIFKIFLFLNEKVQAKETLECDNRYVVLVNPVRGRDLWHDKSITPFKKQYDLIKQHSFPATWLLQYDIFEDKEILDELKRIDGTHELGVFLEVSPTFAQHARVIYSSDVPWFSPKTVFLSGYPQSDRRKFIDRLFKEFKIKFGFYPKSVGAWWIDSYSLNYMKEKYGITSAMIVADQKTTDNYGIWGQWWGVPYYPAKVNILTPASSLNNKQQVLIIQWAQRDPLLSVGEGPQFSNYSLQANDYTERRKDTRYFSSLVDVYLDCKNSVGQVTVGLETGIESVSNIKEYQNQLTALKKISNLQFVTMSRMAEEFARVYPNFPLAAEVKYEDSLWKMTTSDRVNEKLSDRVKYNPAIAFNDYFVADSSNFLDRRLPAESRQKNDPHFRLFLWSGLALGVVSVIKRRFNVWVWGMLFGLAAFGLVFRSYYQYGWEIYYGPVIPELEFFQVGLILTSFLLFLAASKRLKKLYFLPLAFGLDPLIGLLRFSIISNKYYFGFAPDTFRFMGFNVSSSGINFLNLDMPSYQAAALLKFDFNKVWDNLYLALIAYPFIHLLLGIGLIYLLPKLPSKIRPLVVTMSIGLFIWHINNIFNADPRQVVPILLQ